MPSTKTKNRQAHVVYLSKLAIEIIDERKPLTSQSPYVFNSDSNVRGFIHTNSLNKARWRLRKSDDEEKSKDNPPPLADMKPFTIHDLHRSAATCWGEYLKTSPHVIERMLNHQPLNKLIATYQRAVYAKLLFFILSLESSQKFFPAWHCKARALPSDATQQFFGAAPPMG